MVMHMRNSAKLADAGLLVLRLALGIVMMYHGAQKLFGAFGGNGLSQTLEMFQSGMGIPQWLGMLAVIAEFFGGLGIVVGLLTRIASFGVAVTMGVAAFVHFNKGDGWSKVEFPATLMAIAVCLMLTGAGAISLDAAFRKGK